jgi:thioredoxin-dependent peroxiredoxin
VGGVAVEVGDVAPEFTLPGTGDGAYSLSSYRGQFVVLAFYPADNSPVCTLQLNTYTKESDEFEGLNAQVLGISAQDVASHERFSERNGGFSFPLLADTDKSVGKLYGILGPLGFYRRSVFVVDPEGIIRYVHRSTTGLTFKRTSEILDAISSSAQR